MSIEIVQDEIAPAMYQRIINAALTMKRSKFDMAEALYLDIPEKEEGDGQSVSDSLKEVAKQIVDSGGDEIAWGTLAKYRVTAAWVFHAGTGTNFAWRDGVSFTAHLSAAQGSMDYALFAKLPRTDAEVRAMLGNKVPYEVKLGIDTMTDTDKADLITALVDENTELVEDAVQAKYREDIIDDAGGSVQGTDPIPTPPPPSTSTDGIEAIAYMKTIIAGGVPFTNTMLNRWARALSKVHGIMNDDDRNVFAGNLDDIAKLYTEAANQLRSNTWTQQ